MAEGRTNWPRPDEIERIVREVLAGWPAAANGTAPGSSGELVLSAKVVSLAELTDRLVGVSRVVMPRGAVLTPAARDELKHRQIAIASAVCSQAPLAGESVIVAATETNERADGLIDMLTKDGFQIERLATGDVSRTVDAVCDRIASSQRLAILLTGQGAAALCLANRRGGVRAAFGSSVESVVEAVRSVGANLLVTDPAVQGAIAWRQMARAFTRGGRRECPAEWRQRLG